MFASDHQETCFIGVSWRVSVEILHIKWGRQPLSSLLSAHTSSPSPVLSAALLYVWRISLSFNFIRRVESTAGTQYIKMDFSLTPILSSLRLVMTSIGKVACKLAHCSETRGWEPEPWGHWGAWPSSVHTPFPPVASLGETSSPRAHLSHDAMFHQLHIPCVVKPVLILVCSSRAPADLGLPGFPGSLSLYFALFRCRLNLLDRTLFFSLLFLLSFCCIFIKFSEARCSNNDLFLSKILQPVENGKMAQRLRHAMLLQRTWACLAHNRLHL